MNWTVRMYMPVCRNILPSRTQEPLKATGSILTFSIWYPAENGWNTRPDADSYGIVALDFEADALHGDNVKVVTAYEGTVDLYSLQRDGAGWVSLITATLTAHCEGAWSLYSHMYERDTGLFHWTWAFQVEG